ncbi:MAG: hypothetical protein HYZ39_04930 [Mycolicibacterium cosmeticum]|nr:hypothetical protein [Mycolicibacterium cosmeticum]
MNAIIRTVAASALTAGALAGALAMSTAAEAKPLHTATSIQPTCEQHPELYATGAVRGVYSTARRGNDRDQICKVYDAANKLLGTYNTTDYGYYTLQAPQVPPVASSRA